MWRPHKHQVAAYATLYLRPRRWRDQGNFAKCHGVDVKALLWRMPTIEL